MGGGGAAFTGLGEGTAPYPPPVYGLVDNLYFTVSFVNPNIIRLQPHFAKILRELRPVLDPLRLFYQKIKYDNFQHKNHVKYWDTFENKKNILL